MEACEQHDKQEEVVTRHHDLKHIAIEKDPHLTHARHRVEESAEGTCDSHPEQEDLGRISEAPVLLVGLQGEHLKKHSGRNKGGEGGPEDFDWNRLASSATSPSHSWSLKQVRPSPWQWRSRGHGSLPRQAFSPGLGYLPWPRRPLPYPELYHLPQATAHRACHLGS